MTLDDGGVRNAYAAYAKWLDQTSAERLTRKHEQADIMFRRLGITFTVYGRDEGTERLIPFDVIPRILDAGSTLPLFRFNSILRAISKQSFL